MVYVSSVYYRRHQRSI
nr:unnamed protein product [Callosobruchus chinensis]